MLPAAQVSKLQNGLTIVTVPMSSVSSITVLALAKTGSRYEPAGVEGIAHFFEHMVFKGTDKFDTAQELAATVDAVGADFNAFTSKEYTGYYVKSDARHWQLAVDVVSDMLLTPKLRSSDLDRERQVIIEEINMYEDTPARQIGEVFERLLYKGSGLEHDVIGSKQSVGNIKVADFQAFLQKWYGLSNLVVVVAGAAEQVADPELLTKMEAFFSKPTASKREAQPPKHTDFWGVTFPTKSEVAVVTKPTEQAHFVLGLPGINRHDPDRYALGLLGAILGGNTSSRLFSEVREKRGLCYYVHSDVDMYHDGGCFGASAGVDPNRIDEAIEVILSEFKGLVNGQKPVTEAELQRAKDYVEGKTILGLEDSESVAQYYGMKQLLLGNLESPDEVLAKIRAVTLADVNRVAQRLLTSHWRLAVIGPYQDANRFEQLLAKHGTIESSNALSGKSSTK